MGVVVTATSVLNSAKTAAPRDPTGLALLETLPGTARNLIGVAGALGTLRGAMESPGTHPEATRAPGTHPGKVVPSENLPGDNTGNVMMGVVVAALSVLNSGKTTAPRDPTGLALPGPTSFAEGNLLGVAGSLRTFPGAVESPGTHPEAAGAPGTQPVGDNTGNVMMGVVVAATSVLNSAKTAAPREPTGLALPGLISFAAGNLLGVAGSLRTFPGAVEGPGTHPEAAGAPWTHPGLALLDTLPGAAGNLLGVAGALGTLPGAVESPGTHPEGAGAPGTHPGLALLETLPGAAGNLLGVAGALGTLPGQWNPQGPTQRDRGALGTHLLQGGSPDTLPGALGTSTGGGNPFYLRDGSASWNPPTDGVDPRNPPTGGRAHATLPEASGVPGTFSGVGGGPWYLPRCVGAPRDPPWIVGDNTGNVMMGVVVAATSVLNSAKTAAPREPTGLALPGPISLAAGNLLGVAGSLRTFPGAVESPGTNPEAAGAPGTQPGKMVPSESLRGALETLPGAAATHFTHRGTATLLGILLRTAGAPGTILGAAGPVKPSQKRWVYQGPSQGLLGAPGTFPGLALLDTLPGAAGNLLGVAGALGTLPGAVESPGTHPEGAGAPGTHPGKVVPSETLPGALGTLPGAGGTHFTLRGMPAPPGTLPRMAWTPGTLLREAGPMQPFQKRRVYQGPSQGLVGAPGTFPGVLVPLGILPG
ncbi:elastin-like [Homarus americanus]|uniref:elastin-like n=1 Tax=Homarus americanus TaxID=6706 RepID=UPI001C446386|nr:elastin-like [Homarus americanus]